MKLIDHTPLQNEKGEIGIIERIQGTLKFGFNWYPELEAQKFALARIERGLAKGYTAIRNPILGASGIIVPLVLVGPAGIFVIYVTHSRGHYQAKGDSWGTISGGTFKPARVNLLPHIERLARALQTFIERQGVMLPCTVKPILMTANPGMHVESVRPLVRVIMADAIERWAASLSTGAPVFTVESAYELADRIVHPRKPKKDEDIDEYHPPLESQPTPQVEAEQDLSRASTIFAASDEAQPFNPADLEFAYEEVASEEIIPDQVDTSADFQAPEKSHVKKRYLGMTISQLALLGGMIVVELCVLIGFVIIFFQSQ